jgi:hypothetical protein
MEGIQSRAQKPLIEDEGFLHFGAWRIYSPKRKNVKTIPRSGMI